MNIYRHGDLIIKPISKIPSNLERRMDNIVALGEATGHHHKITAKEDITDAIKVYWDNLTQKRYIQVEAAKALLSHEEHKTLELEKGIYEVEIEREYDYFTEQLNQVKD